MRAFIIKFLYVLIWGGLIFCFLKYALPLFMPFVLAFIIAFVLKPIINKIAKKTRIPRKAVAIVVLVLVYALLGTLLALLGIQIVVYLGGWFRKLPAYYSSTIEPAFSSLTNSFDVFLSRLDPSLIDFFNSASESLFRSLSNLISSISSSAVSILTGVAGKVPLIVVAFVLTIIASFFFVVDYYKVTRFISKQMPKGMSRKLIAVKDYIVNVLFKFARAYSIIILITFVEVFIGLLILQVPNVFPIALLTALVDILPVLGTGTIMIPWAVYSLFTGQYFLGIGLLVLYAVITIVRQIIEPRIVGKQIGLYPLLTLVAMFVGARLFGFWGMFGFPVTLTVLIHLNRSGEIALFKE